MEPPKILSPGHVEFPVETEDEYVPFSFRNPFQSSYGNIQTWAAHVQLATASLPTLTILPSASRRFLGRYYGLNNHYFQTSLHIPYGISKDIRFYIATTINKQSPWTTLRGLPHPQKAPLILQRFPNVKAVEKEYCRVMELRDLFWVQALMLERRLPTAEQTELFLKIHTLLKEVHTIIDIIENSILYIKYWGRKGGREIDFDKIEMRRQELRPASHPCNLLQPYMVEKPISGTSTPP